MGGIYFLKKLTFPLLLTGVSLAGGVVNGLLGTGGGIIFAYFFKYLERRGQASAGDAFASAMAVTVPISLVSFFTYGTAASLEPLFILQLALPSAVGGLTGAYLSTKVRPVVLEKVFAALVIYAGAKMIF